jgi:site-specific DNA-methyltransferase (cytosine-N4-specific)
MTVTHVIGDTRTLTGALPDNSIDLIVTSPPFLGLRSYLPEDDPGKADEIGMEPNPAEFIEVLLDLTDEWSRVLKPTGSLVVELGDTYADSGGAGGDYNEGGQREGQPKWRANRGRSETDIGRNKVGGDERPGGHHQGGDDWPLGKSMCMIPHLYAGSLAYGRNLLTGCEHEPWRVRNVVAWCRPNPTPGAQGDKFRKGTSYIVVACRNRERFWNREGVDVVDEETGASVPPLDWWVLPAKAPKKSPITSGTVQHYATFPEEIPDRMIEAMCPRDGLVLDPFGGSGTTLAAAQGMGYTALAFDLDRRNAVLAQEQVGMFLDVLDGPAELVEFMDQWML